MMLDFQFQPSVGVDGVTVMADFPFSALPLQDDDIKETINLFGSNTTNVGITGEVDSDET